jgi:hypothetical protein
MNKATKIIQKLLFGTTFATQDCVYQEPKPKPRKLNIGRTIYPDGKYSFNEIFQNANQQLNQRNAKKN